MSFKSSDIEISELLHQLRSDDTILSFAALADWLFLPKTKSFWASDHFKELHDLDSQEFELGLEQLAGYYPTDFHLLEGALNSNLSKATQLSLKHKDGRTFKVLLQPREYKGENYIYGVQKETSTSKSRLNVLQNQKQLIDTISDAAICLDEKAKVIFWNKKAVEVFGFQKQEAIGRSVQELNLGGDFQEENPTELLSKLIAIKDQSYQVLADKQNLPLKVEMSTNALTDENNQTIGIAAICHDVSEIKKVRAQLEQSIGQMEMAIEGGKLGTWVHYLESGKNVVNYHWANMLGYTKTEVDESMDFFYDHVHPEDLPELNHILKMVENGESDEFEIKLRLKTKQGHWKWVLDRGFVQEYDSQGHPKVTAGIHLDIDEQTRVEQRNQFLSEIVKQSQNEKYVFDIETLQFIFVNTGTRKALGYTEDQLYTMTPLSIEPEFDVSSFRKLTLPVLKEEKKSISYTTKHLRRDGTTYDVEVLLQKIVYGEKEFFFSIVNDISERVLREEHLELLRSVVTNASDSIVITDGDYKPPGPRILYVNEAFTTMTGYKAEEIIGMSPRILQGPKTDSSTLSRIKKSLQSKEPVYAELINYTKSGQSYWVGLSMVPVYREDRVTNWVAIQRDISERIDRDLRMTNTILQEVEAERRNIAAELHDSLTQTLSAVSLIFKNLPYDLPALKTAERFDKAQDLLHEAIDQSRNIAQKIMPKSIEDLGLIEAVQELLSEYNQATSVNLKLNYNSDGRIPQEVELAAYRIIQEALKNIVKHAKASNATVDLTFEPEDLILIVKDNGRGFNPEKQNYFEGIGLRTMRHRVIQLNGIFQINSSEGQGTTLKATIPLKDE